MWGAGRYWSEGAGDAGRYWSGGGGCRREVAGPAEMWSDSDMTELRQGDIKRSVWGPFVGNPSGRSFEGEGPEGQRAGGLVRK